MSRSRSPQKSKKDFPLLYRIGSFRSSSADGLAFQNAWNSLPILTITLTDQGLSTHLSTRTIVREKLIDLVSPPHPRQLMSLTYASHLVLILSQNMRSCYFFHIICLILILAFFMCQFPWSSEWLCMFWNDCLAIQQWPKCCIKTL